MVWTNEKFSIMVAFTSSVSISCFGVQSSIGHLIWFFDNVLEYSEYSERLFHSLSQACILLAEKGDTGLSFIDISLVYHIGVSLMSKEKTSSL